MKLRLAIFLLSFAGASQAHAETYSLNAPHFASYYNSTACTKTDCIKYSTHDHVDGSFVTEKPIAPNLTAVDVSLQIEKYHVTDGHNTISSEDKNSRIASFFVTTDKGGKITQKTIVLQQFLPTSDGVRRINVITVMKDAKAEGEIAFANLICLKTSENSAGQEICAGSKPDALMSRAQRTAKTSDVSVHS
jgi:hypothetical protein